MIRKIGISLLMAGITAVAAPASVARAQTVQPLKSQQIAPNITMINVGVNRIHTFHGISNSHIIETPGELRLVDAQFNFKQARALKTYISSLGKPLVQIILSHNHPDHWFGAEILAVDAPVATSRNISDDLKTGGMRYIKRISNNPKMNGIMPSKVIVPSRELALGKANWDGLEVIIEELPDHESHHSLLIKIPAHGIMIGQDLFYNNMFLVASERSRNANWRKILAGLKAAPYQTLLVGHGQNGGPDILDQDIAYLDALQVLLDQGLGKEATRKALLAKFPEKGGKGMLRISMNNLFRAH